MDDSINKKTILEFQEFGEKTSDVVLLFSPFLPFNNVAFNDFFYNPVIKYLKVFANFSDSIKLSQNDFNYDNMMYSLSNYINKISSKEIHLIGFGIFSNLFVKLAKLHANNISSLVLIEPDFANSLLNRMFDKGEKPINKKKFFLNSYLQYTEVKRTNKLLYRNFMKYVKKVHPFIRENLLQNEALRELTEIEIPIMILWKIMEKDLWPLPQILQEDYGLKTISINTNIIDIFQRKDITISGIFNELISDTILTD